jgi:hypothetical protein
MFTDGRQQRQPNHNTTAYCAYWRTTTTINPIIIRSNCMFAERRQQQQPNHNTTTYCVYERTKTKINTIIIQPHCMFTDRRQQRQSNHNTNTWLVLLLLSSVSNHNMWSYYDWVVVVVVRQYTQYVVVLWLGCRCLPSVNTICGRIMIGLSLLSSVSKHTMWSYYDCIYFCFRSFVNTICGIMITDGRQQQ